RFPRQSHGDYLNYSSSTAALRLVELLETNHNIQAPRAMNAATNTIATTSAVSTAFIVLNASLENFGSGFPCLRADRAWMNVISGRSSMAKTSANSASLVQKRPLCQ